MSDLGHAAHALGHILFDLFEDYQKKRTKEEESRQQQIKESNRKYEWIWVSKERRDLAAQVIAAIKNNESITPAVYHKDPKYVDDLLKELKRTDLIPTQMKR